MDLLLVLQDERREGFHELLHCRRLPRLIGCQAFEECRHFRQLLATSGFGRLMSHQ